MLNPTVETLPFMVVPFIAPFHSFHVGWIPNGQWDIDRIQLDMEVATGTECAHCDLLLVSLDLGIVAAPYANAHNVEKCVYCCDGYNAGPGIPLIEHSIGLSCTQTVWKIVWDLGPM